MPSSTYHGPAPASANAPAITVADGLLFATVADSGQGVRTAVAQWRELLEQSGQGAPAIDKVSCWTTRPDCAAVQREVRDALALPGSAVVTAVRVGVPGGHSLVLDILARVG